MGDPDLAAVLGAPRRRADRAAFTRDAGGDRGAGRGHRSDSGRAEHYPVAHVARWPAAAAYLGLDLATRGRSRGRWPRRFATRDPQLDAATRRPFGAPRLLLIVPVFGDAGDSRGVVVGVIDLPGFAHAR